jgi:putative exporter of polyketide antibiotics
LSIAEAIEATGTFIGLCTFGFGIGIYGGIFASTGTVTDPAQTALKFRVGIGQIIGAGSFLFVKTTGTTRTITAFVAAVTVNTEVRETFVAIGTSLAIRLFGDARCTRAVIVDATMVI